MRIISGMARGIPLTAPKGRHTRPTAERVRESLFATLGDIQHVKVLDLYAGTGALGLEALSRGAGHATFVESERSTIRRLESNIQAVLRQWPDDDPDKPSAEIVKHTVERALPQILRTSHIPDIIFADPPYRDNAGTPTAAHLLKNPDIPNAWPETWLVLEHETNAELPWFPDSPWKPLKQKRYGSTTITIARPEKS